MFEREELMVKNGFALIELVIVITIITIIATIAIPNLLESREQERSQNQRWYVVVEKDGKEIAAWASKMEVYFSKGNVTGYDDRRSKIFECSGATVVSRRVVEKELPALMKKHKAIWIYPKQLAAEKNWNHDPWEKDK